jgi:two-component system osmolarity sensor histidine kinase EnvZ
LDLNWPPGAHVLKDEWQSMGVVVDDIRIELGARPTLIWLHLPVAEDSPLWLGTSLPEVSPRWSIVSTPLPLLWLMLVIGASWVFARRVVAPLDVLRDRMESFIAAPAAVLAMPPPNSPLPPGTVTEVLAMHRAYDALLGRLQQQERERSLLLAGISHDLRSPLGRIRLSAELLPQTPDNLADVAIIVRNVVYADQLVDSFLDPVRVGSLALTETVDLAAVAAAVVARFGVPPEALALQRPVEAVWLFSSNALLLDRLVFNLVDNARKHGRGPVTVCVASTRTHTGMALSLTVTDQGEGLPAAQADVLLSAFARGDASRQVPGSGLGLTVVQQVVARLGGRLSFHSDQAGHHARVELPTS